jgi:uncharacterized protein (TIGR01777 family)
MKVLVTGSTGLIGTALIELLRTEGHSPVRLRRGGRADAGDIFWNPDKGEIDSSSLEGFDAVVHLAGENIASGRWTPERKRSILDSRVKGTSLLAKSLAQLQRPPKVLVSSSAIGYYGDRGEEVLTEDSPAGSGFLPQVCREWEAATAPAAAKGIRAVQLRTGIVLSAKGGALARMLTPFRAGLGGPLGSGTQYMSWIALEDLCRMFLHAMSTESIKGPANAVAPTPVTNNEFTKELAGALHRPALFRAPRFALNLALGEMAEALLLASARVVPSRMKAAGFVYQYPELRPCLNHIVS